MTLTNLYDELDRHDWFYAMSDDHSVWTLGVADESRLNQLAKSIEGGEKLMDDFRRHKFSGPDFGTEKVGKPERPI